MTHAGHAAELLEAEKAFFSVAVPGGFLTALSAVLSGLFLGQGRTRLVGCANGVGCLVYVALVPWFVFDGEVSAPHPVRKIVYNMRLQRRYEKQ